MARRVEPEQPYSMRELRRLIEAPIRRPLLVFIPLVVLLSAAIALSFVLPPRYRSSTLILVAPDRMADGLVTQMKTEKVARRLQTLRQEVQSRTRLKMVAEELDPYGDLGKRPLIETIERMKEASTVSVKGNDAFSIEFEHPSPKMAMLVADRLTTLFMDEVLGSRERQVSDAYQFIDQQLHEAREALEKKEVALREFKERYMGTLPEQVQSNLAILQRLQIEHQTVSESLRKATDTLVLLESGLAPGAAGGGGGSSAPPDPLNTLRSQRLQMLTRYTAEHPDVKALDAQIEALEKARAEAAKASPAAPLDPAAAHARLQIEEARRDVASLRGKLADVESRIGQFQDRVEAAPRREQEILSLTRDYNNLKDNYSSLLDKKLEAQMAASLEQYTKGQQFRMIDPAYMPESPSFPNRGLFALAGALAGLVIGVGLAVVVDLLDPTIKDAEELNSALPYPVLAVIPYVKPQIQRRLAYSPEQSSARPRSSDDDAAAEPLRRVAGEKEPR